MGLRAQCDTWHELFTLFIQGELGVRFIPFKYKDLKTKPRHNIIQERVKWKPKLCDKNKNWIKTITSGFVTMHCALISNAFEKGLNENFKRKKPDLLPWQVICLTFGWLLARKG